MVQEALEWDARPPGSRRGLRFKQTNPSLSSKICIIPLFKTERSWPLSCHLLLMRTCEAEKDGRTEKSEQVAPGLKHWGSLSHAQHPRPSGCILRTGSGDGGLPQPHLRRVFTSSTGPCVGRGDPAVPGPGHFSRKQTQGRWPGRHGRAVAPGPPGPSRETPTCLFVCFLICIYFFVWLNQVSAAAHETFN